MAFCTNCGKELVNDTKFCVYCGQPVNSDELYKSTQNINDKAQPSEAQPAPIVTPPPVPSSKPSPQPLNKRPKTKKKLFSQDVLNAGSYLLAFILLALPVVGLVLGIVWSFGGCKNENLRNLARAYLILVLIIVVFVLLFAAVAAIFKDTIEDMLTDFLEQVANNIAETMMKNFEIDESIFNDIEVFFDDLREYGWEDIWDHYEFAFPVG